MKLCEFYYDLPHELIAQYPLENRAASRMLVLNRKTGVIDHQKFDQLVSFFRGGDVLVLNNTKVFKARLIGKKETGGQFEALLVKEVQNGIWEALVHSSKRLPVNAKIFLGKGIYCVVKDKLPGKCYLEFNVPIEEVLEKIGVVPLPHYIKRKALPADEDTYQTVYAKEFGSIAAPTAGLHFTPAVLEEIEKAGAKVVYITLHIGPGTFRPIRTDEPARHRMEAECVEITPRAADAINGAKRVIGVGTSVTRSLESAASQNQRNLAAFAGFTELFIYPGHQFRIVDHLLTNFHLPCSTPLLLVCAFAGRDLIFKAYKEAIANQYRFLSYGDAMLIL